MKAKLARGGALVTIGYILSPLSFWNDLFINLPIAYVFGAIFGFFSKPLFLPGMIAGYWISNVAGIILMHFGAKDIVSKDGVKYTKKALAKDLLFSVGYTLLIIALVYFGWLKPPTEYFST